MICSASWQTACSLPLLRVAMRFCQIAGRGREGSDIEVDTELRLNRLWVVGKP